MNQLPEQLAQIEWGPILKAAAVLVAGTLTYSSLDNRIDNVETYKAEKIDVQLIDQKLEFIKDTVTRIENKVDTQQEPHP